MNQTNSIGLIILAAGESVRLGTPKQLLKFKGETLLRRIARESLASVCRPIVAVFGGGEIDKFIGELKDLEVEIAENFEWETGMGSSVKTGLRKILELDDSLEAVVLAVCDQPFVTAPVINNLVETFSQIKAPIVASAYNETLGVPVLFGRKFFPLLNELKGSGGAKQIIRQFQDETVGISFPDGATDIDTPQDLARLV